MKKFILIILILGVLIMLKPVSVIIKDSIGNIMYRGNVVTGIVATDNGDGSYDCYISESEVAYPKIFTLSANPNLAVGDKVRILYKGGCKELPIILPPSTAVSSIELFESYLAEGATVFLAAYSNRWIGQTFLTTSAHTINYIELLLARKGIPGTFYVEIKEADVNDLPTGPILTSGNTNGDSMPYYLDTPSSEWKRIDLTEYSLLNNTKYAIIIYKIGGDSSNEIGIWNHHITNPGEMYANGKLIYSTTGGVSWTAITNQDGGFKIYGKVI